MPAWAERLRIFYLIKLNPTQDKRLHVSWLAVAVLLDATLVRGILVPASMQLLGKRNWYLPSWLGWLPDLRVEPQEA